MPEPASPWRYILTRKRKSKGRKVCGCWKVCKLNIFEKSLKSGRCPGCHLTHTRASIYFILYISIFINIYLFIYLLFIFYFFHGETSLYVRSPAWLRELHYTGNPYSAAASTGCERRYACRIVMVPRDLDNSQIRTLFVRTTATVRNTKKWAKFRMPRIEHSVCLAYLSEPTPGMHCLLASGLGTNIFSASLLLAQVLVQFEFCNQMVYTRSYRFILRPWFRLHVI